MVPPVNNRGDPIALLVDIEQRALVRAAGLPRTEKEEPVWSGIGFRVGADRLAASFEEVREVLPPPPVTRVPGVSSWLKGIANVRGVLLPILDLAACLGGEETEMGPRVRVLVVAYSDASIGLLVDEVFGGKHFFAQDSSGAAAGVRATWLRRFICGEYSQGGETWSVVSMGTLVSDPALSQTAL